MSEPVTKAEIEDVLSSIRRLVADNASAIRREPAQPAMAEKLVLTPALRVDDEEPQAEDGPVAASDAQGDVTDAESRALSPLEQRIAELEAVVARSALEFEPDGSEEDFLPETFVFHHQVRAAMTATVARAVEPEAEAEPAASQDGAPGDEAGAWAEPAQDDESAAEVAGAWSDVGEAAEEAEPAAAWSDADEAESFEPEQDATEADTGWQDAPEPEQDRDAAEETRPEPEEVPEDQARQWGTTTEAEPEADEGAGIAEWDEDAEADIAQLENAELEAEIAFSADAAPDDIDDWEEVEAPDPDDEIAEAVIDEEALRELVARMVREELQGTVGERITQNVRRMVRREIARALSLQEFD